MFSTTFPTALQDLDATRGTTGQPLSTPNHITHHTNEDDTIEAIQAKLGIDNSAVTTSIDYLLKSSSSSNPGHKHTFSSLSDFNISSPAAGQSLVYNGTKWVNTSGFQFGGTGADGALSISSGTTTIDCGNAAVVVKNYTSVSITGTGKLAFSNPHANGTTVIIKSQGAVTLTSSQAPMIDMSGMGAAGAAVNTSAGSDGQVGSAGISFSFVSSNFGSGGQNGVDGAAGAINSLVYQSTNTKQNSAKYPFAFVGAGGGAGRCANANPGAGGGGRGGGCLIIECAGAWNFTTSGGISVAGANGTNGTGTSNGGGGGGGGGSFFCFYGSLTANSGTVTVTGGTGGTGTGTHGGGGGGSATAGTTGGGSSGGNGGTGFSLVAANTEFA